MDTTRTHRTKLAAGAVLAGAALFAPSAAATPVKSATTTVTIGGSAAKKLKRAHVRLQAGSPAKAGSRVYRLGVKSGRFDFRTNRGSIVEAGRLQLVHGRRKVVLTGLTFTFGHKSQALAKLGRKTLSLGSLSRAGQVKSSATGNSLSGIQLRLSSASAQLLDRKLGTRALSARGALASLSIAISRSSGGTAGNGAIAGSQGPSAPVTSAATVGFAPAFTGALAQSGLSPVASGDAHGAPDGTLDLPVLSSNIDPQTGTGTIRLAGSVTLGSGDNAIRIQDPFIVVDGGQSGVYAQVNGMQTKLAVLDQSGLSASIQNGLQQLSSAISLTPEGASLLNQLGGVSVFAPGTPIGDISVNTGSSQPAGP